MGYTADSFFEAMLTDQPLTIAASIDFGLDQTQVSNGSYDLLFNLYRNGIQTGEITKQELRDAAGDGPALSKLVGIPVTTIWSNLPPEEARDTEDNAAGWEENDNHDFLAS